MRLGAHLSIAKGLENAAKTAEEIKANTFQFFTRNPRGGAARQISAEEIEKWQEIRDPLDLHPIIGHLPYTVNMASPKSRPYAFAKMVIAEDLKRMEAIGAEYVVIHPGSHTGSGREKGIARIIACLQEVFLPEDGQVTLLLETMAGQGTEIGSLQDVAEILDRLDYPERLGVCLDTCHLTGIGFDFLQKSEVERLVKVISETIGIERIGAIHLNDSKMPPGSFKDRHARIGQGYLGKEGMLNFITHPCFRELPMILETPVDDYKQYSEEIELLRSWLAEVEI
ncbi:MAG: deoxyribonuclease IV [Firmicutes bacterium]|nr:deoxyribonuclease IV [Bacillota bacterium]